MFFVVRSPLGPCRAPSGVARINPSRDFIRRRDSVAAVGFWDHLDSNPHCHVLISASDAESAWLLEEGNKSWLWLQPRGQFDIGAIEAPRKVISYITKEIYQLNSQDQLFVYSAPPAKPAK